MEASSPRKRLPLWKRRFYVHKIQRTYAIRFGLFMFFSSLLVFGLAFLVPFILPAVKLVSQIPLEERARAANQFLVLAQTDRKSTRLNSSHGYISYAVFCLKKKQYNSLGWIRPSLLS